MSSALCFLLFGISIYQGFGMGDPVFFFFFENHVFMLFLALSGSGRTREFSFGVCIRFFFVNLLCLAFLVLIQLFFLSSFFILYSILFPCGSLFYAGASSQPIHLA
jgi:hypothetical protein